MFTNCLNKILSFDKIGLIEIKEDEPGLVLIVPSMFFTHD